MAKRNRISPPTSDRFRIGVHIGDVIVERATFSATASISPARWADRAPGGLCLSETVTASAESSRFPSPTAAKEPENTRTPSGLSIEPRRAASRYATPSIQAGPRWSRRMIAGLPQRLRAAGLVMASRSSGQPRSRNARTSPGGPPRAHADHRRAAVRQPDRNDSPDTSPRGTKGHQCAWPLQTPRVIGRMRCCVTRKRRPARTIDPNSVQETGGGQGQALGRTAHAAN